MNKKIFTLFMMLLLLPCLVSAVENAIYVGGEELIGTDSSPVYAKTVNGAIITDGASENDYHVKWNGSVLTLNGVNIQGNDHEDAAIFYENGDLDIELVGENTVIGVDKNKSSGVLSYGIRTTAGNIKIRGTGSLHVKGGNIVAQYGLAYSYGIEASKDIEVSAGAVISEGGVVSISNSSFNASTGIHAIENVQISGGVIMAIGADAHTQSYGIWTSNGGVSILGGEVTATSGSVGTGSGLMSCGIRVNTNISIVPQDGKVIAVKVGESEENVAEIPGSPFSEETKLTEINDKCFYSKENDHLHRYGDPTYEWSEDNTTCTATRTCEDDASLTETATATVMSEQTKAPTCTEMGEMTYTATLTENWAETQTKTEGIPAFGHNWGEPVYTWSDANTTCTAKRVCKNDASHTESATATVTSEPTKAPTCTEKGEMTYTATFSETWAETQTTTEVIDAIGHGEIEIQNAKEATCTEDGYTGDEVCTVCGEVVTAGEIIPATGHHYVNGYCTECGHRDPNYVDPISYYNIYVEDVCDGVEVTTSKNVVREGGSISLYVEKDTAHYTFDNFKVYYKRSYYGYWEELKEGTQPGEYPIRNIWTHIYVKAEGAEEKEDPTGIEQIEGVKVYTKDGNLYVQTPQREQVIIVSMSGAVVKNEEQIGLKQYHGLQPGIYIVRVGDRAYKLRLH